MLVLPKIPKKWHLWVVTPYDSTSKPTKIFQENSTKNTVSSGYSATCNWAKILGLFDFLNPFLFHWKIRVLTKEYADDSGELSGPGTLGIQEGDDFDETILGRGFDNYVLRDV